MKKDSSNVSPEDKQTWRDDTTECSHKNQLNNAGAALMLKPVIEVIQDHLNLEAEIGLYEAGDVVLSNSKKHSIAHFVGTASSNIEMVVNVMVAIFIMTGLYA